MGKLFDVDSPAMAFLRKCGEMLVANLLWALCSIPVITVGAATAALYHVSFKVIGDEDVFIFKTFFGAFKENFRQATVIWLAMLAVLVGTVFEIHFVLNLAAMDEAVRTILLCVFALVLLLWFLLYIYVFAVQAYFRNTIRNTVFNGVIFGLSYYGYSVLMVILDALALYFGILYAPILVPMVPILMNAWFIRNIFLRHLPNTGEDTPVHIQK